MLYLHTYDVQGNLTCVICRSSIKSATLWKVHINSKQHKKNVEEAKGLKDQIIASVKDITKPSKTTSNTTVLSSGHSVNLSNEKGTSGSSVRKIANVSNITNQDDGEIPAKRPKKTEDDEDFQDTNVKGNRGEILPYVKSVSLESKTDVATEEEKKGLPEQFFDVPVSGKALQEVQDEEWEKFQREIKEETATSNEIIAGEHNEATVDRHLLEIDEQIQRWNKVRTLEEKMERLQKNNKLRNKTKAENNRNSSLQDRGAMDVDESDETDDEEDTEILELFSDWRSKTLI